MSMFQTGVYLFLPMKKAKRYTRIANDYGGPFCTYFNNHVVSDETISKRENTRFRFCQPGCRRLVGRPSIGRSVGRSNFPYLD